MANIKTEDIKIKLVEIKSPHKWAIKMWKVYAGDFYLGWIIKRTATKRSLIHFNTDPGNRKVYTIFQCAINLSTDEARGISGYGYNTKRFEAPHFPKTLMEAKNEFKLAYKKFINSII